MAYAADIISDCLNKTKALFFPIRRDYWLRMGLVSLFGGCSGSSFGNGSSGGSGNSTKDSLVGTQTGLTIKQIVAQLNTKALDFLSQYGYIIGIVFFVFYALSLLLSYINSVFIFVFIDGLVKKEIRIKKSFSENKPQGVSLFWLRFVLGLITILGLLAIFSPLLYSFFMNDLANFNLWLFIPIAIGLFVFLIVLSVFIFLLYDFVVPIMYMQKYDYTRAWGYFTKIASAKKGEIFIYWLLKIVLSIGSGIISLLLLIPIIIVALVFVLLGVGIFFGTKLIFGMTPAIVLTVIYGVIFLIFFIYAISVFFVPIPSFFRIYSIEMVKKLEEKK